LKIKDFEWDEGNILHIELRHGIEQEEAEEVFACKPIFKRTKQGHYAAIGPTQSGRYLSIIFMLKPGGVVRPITGWDMKMSEVRYYKDKYKG
jgi:uncharacterized DUF497 family protein